MTLMRRLVSRAFTPARVAEREARLRELCAEFLDDQLERGTFDYVEDFAAKIPSMIIGALLGVPKEDQDQLRIWGDLMMRHEPDGISDEKLDAIMSHYAYMEQVIRDRAASPRDDMTSDLVAAEIELDDGFDASPHPRGGARFRLAPGACGKRDDGTAARLGRRAAGPPSGTANRLVDDPGLIPNAVEELLRYEAPSPIQARLVTRDVEWYGETVPAGSKVALLTGSAGRDPRQFDDPDTSTSGVASTAI